MSVTQSWTSKISLSLVIAAAALVVGILSGQMAANEDWVFLGLLAAIPFIPLVVRWPLVSTFGLYALLVPFESVAALQALGGATVLKLVGIVTGAVLLAVGLIEGRLHRPPGAALCWALFGAWAMLTASWALDPALALRRLTTVVSLLVLYFVAVSIRPSRKELYAVCALLVIGGAIVSGVGFVDFAQQGADTVSRAKLTIGGQVANANALGEALVLPMILAFAGCVALRTTAQKAIAIGLTGVIGAGIYVSASRGALLALIVAIAFLVYRLGPKREFAVPIVVFVVLATAMPGLFYERINALFTGEDATGSGRTEIWDVAAKALGHFGIFGAGLDNFVSVHSSYVVHGPAGYGYGAHNTYLMVWVELGAIGLALMLVALGSQFLAVYRARREGARGPVLAGLEAACIGVLTFALFGDTIWNKNFWLPLILLTWILFLERPKLGGAGEDARSTRAAESPHSILRQ